MPRGQWGIVQSRGPGDNVRCALGSSSHGVVVQSRGSPLCDSSGLTEGQDAVTKWLLIDAGTQDDEQMTGHGSA